MTTRPATAPRDIAPDPGAGLAVENLCITLHGRELLRLTTRVTPGTVVTVMGPSGSGKSTLLAFVMGLTDPAFSVQGRVLLDGRDITGLPPQARRVGILFQDDLLFPHLSVGGNLAFALPRAIADRRERRTRIEEALSLADLAGFADRDPATLSGGQRARVALVRVLLSEPLALLLDEPFSKLDAGLRRQFREFVFARARDKGLPVLMVTHDREDAEAAGGPIITLGAPADWE